MARRYTAKGDLKSVEIKSKGSKERPEGNPNIVQYSPNINSV